MGDLQAEIERLLSKLAAKVVENESLLNRLNDLDEALSAEVTELSLSVDLQETMKDYNFIARLYVCKTQKHGPADGRVSVVTKPILRHLESMSNQMKDNSVTLRV